VPAAGHGGSERFAAVWGVGADSRRLHFPRQGLESSTGAWLRLAFAPARRTRRHVTLIWPLPRHRATLRTAEMVRLPFGPSSCNRHYLEHI